MAIKDNPNSCLICGRVDAAKPMAFKGEVWCSDRHRKVFNAEVIPTKAEIEAMDAEILARLDEHWTKRGIPLPGWND